MPYITLSNGSWVHYRGRRTLSPDAQAALRTTIERVMANIAAEQAGGPACCAHCGGSGLHATDAPGPQCAGSGQAPEAPAP